MDDSKSKCLFENGNTDTPTPGRDEVTEDKDSESPRYENAEEGDTEDLGMQLWSNHIIMREIMSHLDWRQQVPCELVCRLWRDAVKSLQLVNLLSYKFVIYMRSESIGVHKFRLLDSKRLLQTRPMCAIVFYDKKYDTKRSFYCESYSSGPGAPPYTFEHDGMEAVKELMMLKRSSLLASDVPAVIYRPFFTSRTFAYYKHGILTSLLQPLVGIYLPTMPNVNYRTVQFHSDDTAQEDFYDVVDDICSSDIIKGVLVFVDSEFVTHKIMRYLNYLKNKQPSIPYALGGCSTREESSKHLRVDEDVEVTMGVFSVPKEPEEPVSCCQFNMYSLIIDSTEKEEPAIQEAIQTFAGNISKLEFSAALQFSSSGPKMLDKIYTSYTDVTEKLFGTRFPTSLLGCYCNGTIGYNHPDIRPPPTKRAKRSSDGEPEIGHLNSTVLVYFTWGKQRSSGEEAHHSQQ